MSAIFWLVVLSISILVDPRGARDTPSQFSRIIYQKLGWRPNFEVKKLMINVFNEIILSEVPVKDKLSL